MKRISLKVIYYGLLILIGTTGIQASENARKENLEAVVAVSAGYGALGGGIIGGGLAAAAGTSALAGTMVGATIGTAGLAIPFLLVGGAIKKYFDHKEHEKRRKESKEYNDLCSLIDNALRSDRQSWENFLKFQLTDTALKISIEEVGSGDSAISYVPMLKMESSQIILKLFPRSGLTPLLRKCFRYSTDCPTWKEAGKFEWLGLNVLSYLIYKGAQLSYVPALQGLNRDKADVAAKNRECQEKKNAIAGHDICNCVNRYNAYVNSCNALQNDIRGQENQLGVLGATESCLQAVRNALNTVLTTDQRLKTEIQQQNQRDMAQLRWRAHIRQEEMQRHAQLIHERTAELNQQADVLQRDRLQVNSVILPSLEREISLANTEIEHANTVVANLTRELEQIPRDFDAMQKARGTLIDTVVQLRKQQEHLRAHSVNEQSLQMRRVTAHRQQELLRMQQMNLTQNYAQHNEELSSLHSLHGQLRAAEAEEHILEQRRDEYAREQAEMDDLDRQLQALHQRQVQLPRSYADVVKMKPRSLGV